MLQSRKSFVKDKDGTESRLTYGSNLDIKRLEAVGGNRYQHSAVDILKYDQNVRTGGHSILLGPLGAVFKKKKKERLLSIASAGRKHTDGERVEQGPCASGFSMSCHTQVLILSF
jgi:hypothetical protein